MVLSKIDIREYIQQHNLISNYEPNNIQTSSYDLRFSGEYCLYDEKDSNNVRIRNVEEGEYLLIPADAVCFILSEETINMTNDLSGDISLSFGLIKSGVMLSQQPPIDAGYRGRIVAMLHNLSDEDIRIKKGAHVLNIAFYKLCTPLLDRDLYDGDYQGLRTLKDYCRKPIRGGVFSLARDYEKSKKSFQSALPRLFTIISIIIALLTGLVTLITAGNLIFGKSTSNSSNSSPKTTCYEEVESNSQTYEINSAGSSKITIDFTDKKVIIEYDKSDE